MSVSWGAIGSFFLGPFVRGLLLRRATKAGAFTSSILGLGTCLVLSLTGMQAPQAGTIGMMVSLAVIPVLSLVGVSIGTSARSGAS